MRRVVCSLLVVLAAALAAPLSAQPAQAVQGTSGSALGVSIPLELREQLLVASSG